MALPQVALTQAGGTLKSDGTQLDFQVGSPHVHVHDSFS